MHEVIPARGELGVSVYAFQGEFLPFRWLSTLAVET